MLRKFVLAAFLVVIATSAFAGDKRRPYYAHGSISQMKAYRGGYRIWIDGARYPFFVPASRYRELVLQIGMPVNFGGYYNRRGYYDYYCFDCYRDASSSYARRDDLKFKYGTVRGKVDSVDERHGTFIIIAEGNDSPVTVRRGNDRGLGELKVGDYLEVDGEWTRTGYFDAVRIDYADTRRD
jgi:hypothetical protein